MARFLKQIFIFTLLLLPILSFSQGARFIEITVSDTLTLKSTGFTYQIDNGQKNKQLYIKYGLTAEEIGFIESMVKPMN